MSSDHDIRIDRLDDGAFQLLGRQWLPIAPPELFPFFADAANLETLTPPWLSFNIITPQPIDMREGALIDYRIKLRGLPLTWRTEIQAWEPPHRFIDVQLKGPYRQWIHEHTFEPHADGSLLTDRVTYRVPGGALVNRFFVAPDIRKIFQFRQKAMDERFNPQGLRPRDAVTA